MSILAYLDLILFNFTLLRLVETSKINDLKGNFFDKHEILRTSLFMLLGSVKVRRE